MIPFKCPYCGRFSKDGWETWISEYTGMWGAACKEHGEWRDST